MPFRSCVGRTLGCLVAIAAMGPVLLAAAPPPNGPSEIRIIPAYRGYSAPPHTATPPHAGGPAATHPGAPPNAYDPRGTAGPSSQEHAQSAGFQGPPPPWLYAAIYRSIPFSRAEYEANPLYRQQTTMSLLFGAPANVSVINPMGRPPIPQYGYITPYLQPPANLNRDFYFPQAF